MGIPERRKRDRDRRKKQIITAAKRLFLEKGFEKTTMEDIAGEAELSAGTLYLYFKNKHELYASITLNVLHFLNDRLSNIRSKKSDLNPEEKLEVLKKILLDSYKFDSMSLANLFHLQSREILQKLSSSFIKEIKAQTRQVTEEIADIFQEGIDKGVFIDRHPAAFAQIIISIFAGIVLWEESKKSTNNERGYLQSTIQLSFEILSKGLIKKNHIS